MYNQKLNFALWRLDANGNLLQFMSVATIHYDPTFFYKSMVVISETEVIIGTELDKSKNGYSVTLLKNSNADIGLASISSNLTCNWLWMLDINSDTNMVSDIMQDNGSIYMLAHTKHSMLHFAKFNMSTKQLSTVKNYLLSNTDDTYSKFDLFIVGMQSTSKQAGDSVSACFQIAKSALFGSTIRIASKWSQGFVSFHFEYIISTLFNKEE